MNKILAIVFVLLLSACTTDFYETGDSPLSYLRTDFVEIRTAAPTIFTKAITDDSDTLLLDPSIKANWAQTADSTYRALLYYRKTALRTVTPLAINYIPVVRPTMKTDLARFADPVTLQSAWISKNRKYLNLALPSRQELKPMKSKSTSLVLPLIPPFTIPAIFRPTNYAFSTTVTVYPLTTPHASI
uniref:hypothetical protein n=1 Tax=Prevotella micans TaxID=189723 RepID=UPI000ACA03CE